MTVQTMQTTGRTKVALSKKLNPVWWFGNDGEPNPPAWYKPGSSERVRRLFWYLRNPLMNFQDYVIGVADRNYSVYGKAPVDCIDRIDLGQTGWQWSVIAIGLLRLPFVSYTGKRVLWHVGWYYNGRFQVKFNLLGFTQSPV